MVSTQEVLAAMVVAIIIIIIYYVPDIIRSYSRASFYLPQCLDLCLQVMTFGGA